MSTYVCNCACMTCMMGGCCQLSRNYQTVTITGTSVDLTQFVSERDVLDKERKRLRKGVTARFKKRPWPEIGLYTAENEKAAARDGYNAALLEVLDLLEDES